MLEARVQQGILVKKLLDSINNLVEEGNLDCSATSISMQAMDSAHVALVSILLKSEGFDFYRADRSVSLGVNIVSLQKMFKCLDSKDAVTLKAADEAEILEIVFDNDDQGRISNFELKLMDIDSEHLAVPDTDFKCFISMPSAELQRICRDLSALGESITISASKDGLKFTVDGTMGKGTITCQQNDAVDEKKGDVATTIECIEPVELQFSIKYLNDFAKSASLSKIVNVNLAPGVPILVEFPIEELGHLRFYLAPKMEDDE